MDPKCVRRGGLTALLGMIVVTLAPAAWRGPQQRDSEPPMNMESSAQPGESLIRVGEPLPAFAFADVNGREVSSRSLRGQALIVDVWASWCAPCKEEMPAFEKLRRKYASKGFAVVGISIDMSAEEARDFAKSIGVGYPIVHRPAIMEEWGLLGLPTTIVLDRAGIVRRVVVGFEYPEAFEKMLLEIL